MPQLLLLLLPLLAAASAEQPQRRRGECNATYVGSLLHASVRARLDPGGAVDWAALASSPRIRCDGDGFPVELDLSRMGLNGSLPDGWDTANAPRLLALDASYNDLRGTLPEAWATDLRRLESLNLKTNQRLGGTLPAAWSVMSTLTALDLNHSAVTGTVPHAWSALTALQILDLSHSRLHGALPPFPFPSMRNLGLKNNSFEGSIPARWSEMAALCSLDLGCGALGAALLLMIHTASHARLAALAVLMELLCLSDGALTRQGAAPRPAGTTA
jgi:hypothetical protein